MPILILCAVISAQSEVIINDPNFVGPIETNVVDYSNVVPTPFPSGIISSGRIIAQGVDVEMQSPDTGVILVDENTNKWVVSVISGEVVGTQISASPEVSMEERRARLQAERNRRQAIRDELGLTQQQIDLIRQWANADTDALFSNLNDNQRRFMKIQHQLLRMLAKRELKEIE